MSKYGLGLARIARLGRRQLIAFAILSAAINGVVTAGVGAWLAQTYSRHQGQLRSVENISNLFYARRTRAGMVASSLRRSSDLEELRERKRAYDEAYVDWNTNIRKNLFVIREVLGAGAVTRLEQHFEDNLVRALADIDACLTRAYDTRLGGGDPLPVLEGCRMAAVYQLSLDCGASYTNELYRLSRLSFLPFGGVTAGDRAAAETRVLKACTAPPLGGTAGPTTPTPAAPTLPGQAVPPATSAQPEVVRR